MKNARLIDLTGQTFGKWTVLRKNGNKAGGAALWLCQCECGRTGSPSGTDLRLGKSTNCGCAHKGRIGHATRKHGDTGTRLHRIWKNMRARCMRRSCPGYAYYGGRGIAICDEWQDFSAFRDWALRSGYQPNLSIERVDVDGNYSPSNCTWADSQTQSANRRFVKRDINGVPWSEIARQHGNPVTRMNCRVHSGWPVELAATAPKGARLSSLLAAIPTPSS